MLYLIDISTGVQNKTQFSIASSTGRATILHCLSAHMHTWKVWVPLFLDNPLKIKKRACCIISIENWHAVELVISWVFSWAINRAGELTEVLMSLNGKCKEQYLLLCSNSQTVHYEVLLSMCCISSKRIAQTDNMQQPKSGDAKRCQRLLKG